METILAILLTIREPSPTACDAVIENWITLDGEVPADLPKHLGPAIQRYQEKHELWRWDTKPVWSSAMVRSEIEWTRQYRDIDFPSLEELARLPSDEEMDHYSTCLCWSRHSLMQLLNVASPWNEDGIKAYIAEIERRQSILSSMRSAKSVSGNLVYRRRSLAELRNMVGPFAWVTGNWPLGVPQ